MTQRDLINAYILRYCQQDETRPLPMVPSDRTRDSGYKLKHRKFHLNMRRNFEGDRTLEQTAQRACGVSLPGDIQNTAVCDPATCSR